jgi:hypothetical protein
MKRGQAAMEFLMTYGWVILVILVAISALAYFGVLNPDKNLPETCIFFPGISCGDFIVDENGVRMIITNGMGKHLNNVTFTVLGDGPCSGDSSTSSELRDGTKVTFEIVCTEKPTTGTAFRRDIQVTYMEGEDGLVHTKKGNIHSRVE